MKKLNQAKADGSIEKGDINDGEEQQNQATRNSNGCREPVIINEEENPAKKVPKTLAEELAEDLTNVNIKTLTGKLAKDLGKMVNEKLTRGGPCTVPCSGRPLPGPLPTEHHNEKKAKEDTETYEEATDTLSRLLNKYGEGKNRYKNLHRMINAGTFPIKRAGQAEKVQKKAEGDTEQDNNLQDKKKMEEGENAEGLDKINIGDSKVEKKVEEREKAEGPDEGNKAVTEEGGNRNKDGRSKADENKALTGGHEVKTQIAYPVSKDNGGSQSYPLVNPRPEETTDIDDSTVVQCTGAGRSTVHPLDVMDNTLYSQHLEDEK